MQVWATSLWACHPVAPQPLSRVAPPSVFEGRAESAVTSGLGFATFIVCHDASNDVRIEVAPRAIA